MDDNKVSLNDWFNTYYDDIITVSEELKEKDSDAYNIDYYKFIGVSLSIFSIFEYSMYCFFEDFKRKLLDDTSTTLSQLPAKTIAKLFSNRPESLTLELLLKYLSMSELSHEKNKEEKHIRKQIDEYFCYKHLNTNNDKKNNAALERINSIFFEGTFLDSDIDSSWFTSLKIEHTNDFGSVISGSEIELINASSYIREYSTKVRHILAHRIPTIGDADDYDMSYDFFKNKTKYSPKYSAKIFKKILNKMYDKYQKLHKRDIYIENNYYTSNSMDIFKNDED